MKKLLYMSLMMVLACVCTLGFTSCSDDDDDNNVAAPTIKLNEANIEGNELCVEADVKAPAGIAAIVLNIFDSTGKTSKVANPVTATKYIGVLNIDGFHVHINIAGKNVVVGDMLKMTVVDAKGQVTMAEKTVTQEEDEDENHNHD